MSDKRKKPVLARLCDYFKEDERFCLICQAPLCQSPDLEAILLGNRNICANCERSFTLLNRTYHMGDRTIHVLFEYDEFMERLFFQFKEGADVLLAPYFLTASWARTLRTFDLLAVESWHEKAAQRGFETLERIAEAHGLHVFYPFEKTCAYKQSSLDRQQRQTTGQQIRRKALSPAAFSHPVIFEDVVTTGATLKRLFELSGAREAWVLAAHPLWLAEHEKSEDRSAFALFADHIIVRLQNCFQRGVKR